MRPAFILALVVSGCATACPLPTDAAVDDSSSIPVDAPAPVGCAAFPDVGIVTVAEQDAWLTAHILPRVTGCGLRNLGRDAPEALLLSFPELGAATECAPLWLVRDEMAACALAWERR